MSIYEEVGPRKAREPTHKCPRCKRTGMGKRAATCSKCEEELFDTAAAERPICIDCDKPVGKHHRLRCNRCHREYERDNAAEYRRIKYWADPEKARAINAVNTKKFKSTPRGKELVERDWRKQNDKRLVERRAAGKRQTSDAGRARMSAGAQRRWARVRAQRVLEQQIENKKNGQPAEADGPS